MTLQYLFNYPAFRGLGYLAIAACFILAGVVGMFILSHIMFRMGHKSSLYAKRKPVPGWSKRFYPAAAGMLVLLVGIGLWLRGYLY